jgi:hypothetical protein
MIGCRCTGEVEVGDKTVTENNLFNDARGYSSGNDNIMIKSYRRKYHCS